MSHYGVRLWRDGQLWRGEWTDRDGRVHAILDESALLGTLLHVLAERLLESELA